jgi:hypothetical protein
MARRKSIDIGSYLGWGIAAVGAYWIYSNWGTINATLNGALSSVTTALTPVALPVAVPVTTTTGGIVPATSAQSISNLVSQAQAAQQAANDATAAGNPNAPLLQAQASQELANAMAAVPSVQLQAAGLTGLNVRHMRRVA